MPQTRFVTQKAFEMGLRPIVVINKIDRPRRRPDEVIDQVFDLFDSLGANDQQLDFPVIYASGREGFAIRDLGDEPQGPRRRCSTSSSRRCRRAEGDPEAPLLHAGRDARLRRLPRLHGDRPHARRRAARSATACCSPTATAPRKSSASRRSSASRASSASSSPRRKAGDIVAFTGMSELNVGETITSIAEPDDPAAAQDRRADDHDELPGQRRPVRRQGRQVRHLAQPRASACTARSRATSRCGSRTPTRRRHLQGLGPRRAPPLGADRDDAPRGLRAVRVAAAGHHQDRRATASCSSRTRTPSSTSTRRTPAPVDRGARPPPRPDDARCGRAAPGRVRLEYRIPARGLIGYRSQFMTDTRGTGVLYTQFAEYGPWAGDDPQPRRTAC